MWSVRKPTPETLRQLLAGQVNAAFTYGAVGATAATPPTGFDVDRTRARLGDGEAVFHAATSALRRWCQFDLGWAGAWPSDTPLRAGELVAITGRAAGIWWLNACRIVYVIDEDGPARRFGFAYGTLPAHVERGEERFLIEWNRSDDSVWYDILAFSDPHHIMARLGYAVVRRLQKRFGRDSAAAMRRATLHAPHESR